jgi:putative NIF3 family GTP cyclohydrolase 1 type 2
VKKDKIALLLRHGISLLAYHLPLDAHQEIGNNWKAAKDLGWIDLEGFHQEQTKCIGVKGRFPKMSRDAFQSQLEKYYGQKAALAFGGKEIVSSSALISGGAYRIMEEAADEGLDCYITGNFDEPAWHLAHEGKINFFALGHAATEQVGPKALADYIQHQMGIKPLSS